MDIEAMIKYRTNSMKSLSGHMGALARTVEGKVGFRDLMLPHARAIAAISHKTAEMFPEGTDFGNTDAKAEIWSRRAEFDQAAATAAERADELVAAVQGDDMTVIGPAFKAMGKACKGCHDQFREK
jgi:cytochrome c556